MRTDSQLVVSNIRGETKAKDPILQLYLKLDSERLERFKVFEIAHVLREENNCANMLSLLANTRILEINHYFFQKIKKTPSIKSLGKMVTFVDSTTPLRDFV